MSKTDQRTAAAWARGDNPRRGGVAVMGLAIAAAAGVTAALYLWASAQTAQPQEGVFGRHGLEALTLKSWMATAVLMLALLQVVGALWMYGRLPGGRTAPRSIGVLHRINGIALVALAGLIAWQCVRVYGVQTYAPRVMVHAIAGCFFFGAFAAKLVIVRSKRLPGWNLPAAGGLLVTTVAVLWLSSSFWFFTT